jgi:hypothetical protein
MQQGRSGESTVDACRHPRAAWATADMLGIQLGARGMEPSSCPNQETSWIRIHMAMKCQKQFQGMPWLLTFKSTQEETL